MLLSSGWQYIVPLRKVYCIHDVWKMYVGSLLKTAIGNYLKKIGSKI